MHLALPVSLAVGRLETWPWLRMPDSWAGMHKLCMWAGGKVQEWREQTIRTSFNGRRHRRRLSSQRQQNQPQGDAEVYSGWNTGNWELF